MENNGSSLVRKISIFSATLRANGIPVTTSESVDAVKAITFIDLYDRSVFYHTLKATLVKRLNEIQLFDLLFQEFWIEGAALQGEQLNSESEFPRADQDNQPSTSGNERTSGEQLSLLNERNEDEGKDNETRKQERSFYSYLDSQAQGKHAINAIDSNEISRMRRNISRLISNLELRESRRLIASHHDGRINIRRTLRRNSSSGWEFVHLVRTVRKKKRPDVILLCDVSGSMTAYYRDLATLILTSCSYFARAHVFCFSTRLEEIKPTFVREAIKFNPTNLSSYMGSNAWGSGTRIGEILCALLNDYSETLRRKSVLIIVSDGLDCGDTLLLSAKLGEIRERTGYLIWINPLADSPTFKPITKGMQAALPCIDLLQGFSPIKR